EITASEIGGGMFDAAAMVSSIKLVQDLHEIAEDDSIKAVVLRVNSPGGSAAGSDEIFHAIRAVQVAGKPVVVSMGDVAASGGYYISAPADYIYANGATLTGSIGVIFQLMNFEGLAEKVGIDDITLTAGKNKDIGNPFRPMKPEEKQMLTDLLTDVHDQFITAVADGRKKTLTEPQVRTLATGQIWTGSSAVKAGLVDAVGSLRDAEAKARTLAKLPVDAEVVEYGDSSFFDLMFGAEAGVGSTGVDALMRRHSAGFLQQLSGSLFLNTTLRDLVIR
ncbi:MAG: signal peptide peptidase SppA, partial [bacterium]|nr:signal peptide peptidase SppA [bacterium]